MKTTYTMLNFWYVIFTRGVLHLSELAGQKDWLHGTSPWSFKMVYSQPSPCGHLAITDSPIIRAAAKSPAKINYRRLTEINSRYYGLSLLSTLTHGPEGVCSKGS